MKTIAVLAVAGLAAAQLSGVPTCAQPCVTQFTSGTDIAGCKQLDIACICSNQDFLKGVACCLTQKCSQADQQAAVSYAQQICTSAGVTVPNQVVCNNATATIAAPSSSSTSTSNAGPTADAAAAGGVLGAAIAALAML